MTEEVVAVSVGHEQQKREFGEARRYTALNQLIKLGYTKEQADKVLPKWNDFVNYQLFVDNINNILNKAKEGRLGSSMFYYVYVVNNNKERIKIELKTKDFIEGLIKKNEVKSFYMGIYSVFMGMGKNINEAEKHFAI